MGVPIAGGVSGALQEVDVATLAARVTQRPYDFTSGGVFQLVSKSGNMAAGLSSASPIYSFRNASSSLVCVLQKLHITAWSQGTGFTAGLGTFDLFQARSWSAADTGGTTDTITVNNAKLRTSMASISALAEVRHSSTGTLTAGTRSLDAQALASANAGVGTGTWTVFADQDLLSVIDGYEYPPVIGQNEGVVLQATVPATGLWAFAITAKWMEAPSFAP